jgi:hypothetical protein
MLGFVVFRPRARNPSDKKAYLGWRIVKLVEDTVVRVPVSLDSSANTNKATSGGCELRTERVGKVGRHPSGL